MNTYKIHIGKRIMELVAGSKYTVKQVAKHLGISPSNIYRFYERESVESKYLVSLAQMFEIPVSYFFQEHVVADTKKMFETIVKDAYEKRQEVIKLLRETTMRGKIAYPECQQDLEWRNEGFLNRKFTERLFDTLGLGRDGSGIDTDCDCLACKETSRLIDHLYRCIDEQKASIEMLQRLLPEKPTQNP